MGLWNFVKSAGKSLIGKDDAPEEVTQAALVKEVGDLGFKTDGLDISVDGDKVKISGDGIDQETKEKIILAVGNVEGVAEVEEDISGNDPVFHTVEKGDTLWGIAQKTLGDGNRHNEIFEANKPMLSHPDKIYPGQVLRIPT
ncbi:peptidoglycan-binding protein LysM [Parasulfitobacter algicola]|uniref:Peptidoglycan-binding protein LysM n=1 Tax=Parasulfitobacter algicola TaxID=2614809 RepID=A0ABX2IJX1_9RHOB|nr:peptidoglycan-binding protein LysM [Sulfitobacter algicola]NSX53179.1 peptidoglycan-binding protein LysM [Sulfitobacter algicola]